MTTTTPTNRDAVQWARPSLLTRVRRTITPYFYVAPFFIVFAAFGLYPMIYTAWVSLHDWDPLGDATYLGLDNFRQLLWEPRGDTWFFDRGDPRFWNSVRNTFSIWLLSTIPQLFFAIGLAQVLNDRFLRGRNIFRMAVLVPNITSVLAVAIVFTSLFGRDYGIINAILAQFGADEPINWSANRWSSHIAIATMITWRWTGYNALIYLAGMQAIPRQLYEAAEIDGASKWRQFIHVTIPQLRPTIIFTVIISTIGGLQVFAEPLVFGGGAGTEGGTGRQFQTMTLFLYEQGFRRFNFGYASAVAWILLLIIALIALINFLIVRRISTS